jgi:hypothetical protein
MLMLVLPLLIEIEPFEHEHDYEQELPSSPETFSRDKAWRAGTRS